MRPTEKGWIDNYVCMLVDTPNKKTFIPYLENFKALSSDHKLYKLAQPSGLMYGHPIQTSRNYQISMSNWNEDEKMKFILMDCLLNEALLFRNEKIQGKNDLEDLIQESIKSIAHFYQENDIIREKKVFKKSESRLVESIMNNRVKVKPRWTRNFWAGFFQNSLLFLDVFYFSQWLRKSNSSLDESAYQKNQENLRLTILQIIASAAWANSQIEEEEKALFNFFLQSAGLSKEKEKWAGELLKSNSGLESLELTKDDPWIIRKYILELAILTVWADRQFEEVEKKYINELAKILFFTREELDESLLAVESFVISHWEQIHFLQSKHDLIIIKDRFSKQLSKVVNRNKNAFVQEIRESKELMSLMMKMTKEKLSESEKAIVKAQLVDVLKTLPTFVIIALPGTFITLPLLLKLLPAKAFPSAFSEMD